jgi:hypothetical protein
MGGRDDLKVACVAASRQWDHPRRVSGETSRTSSKVWRSDCKEPPVSVTDKIDRSFRPSACTGSCCAKGAGRSSPGISALSMQRAVRSRSGGSRRQFAVGVERSGRLCVLMNPILPGAIQSDLAGVILKISFSCHIKPFRPGQELQRFHSCYIPKPLLQSGIFLKKMSPSAVPTGAHNCGTAPNLAIIAAGPAKTGRVNLRTGACGHSLPRQARETQTTPKIRHNSLRVRGFR